MNIKKRILIAGLLALSSLSGSVYADAPDAGKNSMQVNISKSDVLSLSKSVSLSECQKMFASHTVSKADLLNKQDIKASDALQFSPSTSSGRLSSGLISNSGLNWKFIEMDSTVTVNGQKTQIPTYSIVLGRSNTPPSKEVTVLYINEYCFASGHPSFPA